MFFVTLKTFIGRNATTESRIIIVREKMVDSTVRKAVQEQKFANQ